VVGLCDWAGKERMSSRANKRDRRTDLFDW
jgi:hypothetical protein